MVTLVLWKYEIDLKLSTFQIRKTRFELLMIVGMSGMLS